MLENKDRIIKELEKCNISEEEIIKRDIQIAELKQKNEEIQNQNKQIEDFKFYGPIKSVRQDNIKNVFNTLDRTQAEKDCAKISEDGSNALYDKVALKNRRNGNRKPILRGNETVAVPSTN